MAMTNNLSDLQDQIAEVMKRHSSMLNGGIFEINGCALSVARMLLDQGVGCPCEPAGSDGLTCPGPDGKLLCDKSVDSVKPPSQFPLPSHYPQPRLLVDVQFSGDTKKLIDLLMNKPVVISNHIDVKDQDALLDELKKCQAHVAVEKAYPKTPPDAIRARAPWRGGVSILREAETLLRKVGNLAYGAAADDLSKATTEIIDLLQRLRLRIPFNGMPSESFWNIGSVERPHWVPDWRYELQTIEHTLFGSEVKISAVADDTMRYDQLVKGETALVPANCPTLEMMQAGNAYLNNAFIGNGNGFKWDECWRVLIGALPQNPFRAPPPPKDEIDWGEGSVDLRD